MGACLYGSYALDAAATLYVTPVEDRMTSLKIEKRATQAHWVRIRDVARLGAAAGWTIYNTACSIAGYTRPYFNFLDAREAALHLGRYAYAMAAPRTTASTSDVVAAYYLNGVSGRWRVVVRYILVGDLD
jgi:hypothetical protein